MTLLQGTWIVRIYLLLRSTFLLARVLGEHSRTQLAACGIVA